MKRDFYYALLKVRKWLRRKAEKVKGFVARKVNSFRTRIGRKFRGLTQSLRQKWGKRWRPIINYSAFSLAPYVLAYGMLLNTITLYFIDMSFSPLSVVSHGLLWYFLKEELFQEMLPELRPTVKADVKVKDK